MSVEANFQKFDQKLTTQQQQMAAISHLGQRVLMNSAPEGLLNDAATLIAQVLPADIVLISELDAEKKLLLLRAIVGCEAGMNLEKPVPFRSDSLEALVFQSPSPIVVDDFSLETRFRSSRFLMEIGAVSGIAVSLGTVNRPPGIMQAFSRQRQTFSQTDLHFFHSIANLLTLSRESEDKDVESAAREQDFKIGLRKAESAVQTGHLKWDQDEIKNRLVESRERERLRLAQELHDVPIQDLYGLMYQMEDLKDIVKNGRGMEILEDFNHTLHRVVNNLRTICGELHPPSLSPFGLEVAIRDHVEKLRTSNPGLQFHLELMRDRQILPEGIRLCLFRIYQHAINNVIRHAQAMDVYIRFRWDEQVVVLEVEDNGHGFKLPAHWVDLVQHEHFGLMGIAERVESVRGTLEIESTLEVGTLIRVSVPRR